MIELANFDSRDVFEKNPDLRKITDRLISALATHTRGQVRNARREERGKLNDCLNALTALVSDYDGLPDKIMDLDYIIQALLAEDGENLKKVAGLRRGGELFGISEEGIVLFKDRGTQPIIYGYAKDGGLIQMDEYNPAQLRKMVKAGNYHDVRRCVHASGYELMRADGKEFSDEMKQCEANTGAPLVRNEARDDQNVGTWLESGHKPEKAAFAYFSPHSRKVILSGDNAFQHDYSRGAIRIFRMKVEIN